MKEKTLVKDVTDYLEKIAPLALQENYDNSGLIIGNKQAKVTNVLLTLDCTEDVVDEAINKKCNLIIAHHPILFSPLKKINGSNYIERVIIKCIKNDIAIYACHTNLDNIAHGVNKIIAERIGLENIKILSPKTETLCKLYTYAPEENVEIIKRALYDIGAGQIGNYEECSFETTGIGSFKPTKNAKPFSGKKEIVSQEREQKIEVLLPFYLKQKAIDALKAAHPYEEVAYEIVNLTNQNQDIGAGMIGELPKSMSINAFLELVSVKMKAKNIKYTHSFKNKIKKVAICGGSGSFLLNAAKANGAQAFVTSDFKYHEFFDAEKSLTILDIGHYETEQYTPQLFYRLLSEKFTKFALHLSKVNTNPIKYYQWQKQKNIALKKD